MPGAATQKFPKDFLWGFATGEKRFSIEFHSSLSFKFWVGNWDLRWQTIENVERRGAMAGFPRLVAGRHPMQDSHCAMRVPHASKEALWGGRGEVPGPEQVRGIIGLGVSVVFFILGNSHPHICPTR